jgi:hypothetical protein
MMTLNWKEAAVVVALAIASACATTIAMPAQEPVLDPAAVHTLKRMTGFLGGLEKFSVHVQNTLEDLLVNGQRIDIDFGTQVLARRPDRLYVTRVGELIDQDFYYDGESLTLYNANNGVFATEPAPGTIEEMLDFAREQLSLVTPATDLMYRNAFAIIMHGVTSGGVYGKAMIGGNICTHLLFSRPDVDIQVWVADGDQPLPCKYVVTDKSTPQLISTVSVMSDWNLSPSTPESQFEFVPPEGAKRIIFVPADDDGGSDR